MSATVTAVTKEQVVPIETENFQRRNAVELVALIPYDFNLGLTLAFFTGICSDQRDRTVYRTSAFLMRVLSIVAPS